MEELTLTDEMIEMAYGGDESIRQLISLTVLKMMAGVSFERVEAGVHRGWRGEGGYYGSKTALGKVLEFSASIQVEDK